MPKPIRTTLILICLLALGACGTQQRLLAPQGFSTQSSQMAAQLCAVMATAPADSPVWREKGGAEEARAEFMKKSQQLQGRQTARFLREGKPVMDPGGNAVEWLGFNYGPGGQASDVYVTCLIENGFRWGPQ